MPKTIKQMTSPQRERPESALQFEQIYEEHHDPLIRQQRKIRENREQRAKNISSDAGL